MAQAPRHEQPFAPPRSFEVSVVAVDPSITIDDKVLRAKVKIPATRLEPGPRGSRFHVVDYDASAGSLVNPPVDLAPGPEHPGWVVKDRIAECSDAELSGPECRAQNVYAIAARTLASFEYALGRPVPWAFGSHHLYLVPAAFAEANAYYADTDQALCFGYLGAPGASDTVYAGLAYDIVAHETTHAILDGLRNRFDAPGLPDQSAFHEGFADVVALLSVFSIQEVVAAMLVGGAGDEISRDRVSDRALVSSPLFELAKQLGDALHANRGNGLRNSVTLPPTVAWKEPGNLEWEEPHHRGEILVAAVTQTLASMWQQRLADLVRYETLSRTRAAEEGARAARHLLEMAIRAIDYCPPVLFEFRDFLDAILVSDSEVAPEDEFHYRDHLQAAFGQFGIAARPEPPLRFAEGKGPSYQNFHYAVLRADPDEAARFIWENAKALGVDSRFYIHVEDVRPAVRVGPDGFVVSETVVDYVQELVGSPSDLRTVAGPGFAGNVPDSTRVKLLGGGTLIFDQFGGVKIHRKKSLEDWGLQQQRLDYLVRRGIRDTRGGLGFSFGAPLGQRFAQFHQPDDGRLAEEW
jgi:hypothetical protein